MVGGHLGLAAALVPIGYWSLFSTFRDWDDEGYFILALRAFVDGSPLYDDVYTQYGPFPYEVFGGIAALVDVQFTTNSVRFVTLATWIAAAVLAGVATTRLTRSVTVGLAAQIVAFATCRELVNTPMHPTGLILVLLGCFAVGVTMLGTRQHRFGSIVIGVLTAGLLLTKPNVGGLLLVGIGVTVAAALARTVSGRMVSAVVATVAAASIPVVLMRDVFSLYSSRAFVTAVVAGLVALGAHAATGGAGGSRKEVASFLRVGAIAAGATAVVVLGVVLAHGTSPGGLVRGLVLEPLALDDAYFVAIQAPFGSAALATALAVVGTFMPILRRQVGRRGAVVLCGVGALVALGATASLLAAHAGAIVGTRIEVKGALVAIEGAGWPVWMTGAAALASGCVAIVRSSSAWPIAGGLVRIAAGLAGWLAIAGESDLEGLMLPLALAWLVLVPPSSVALGDAARFGRLLLATTAILQTVMVYPVGGSQARLAVLLLVITLGIVVGDGVSALRSLAGGAAPWRLVIPPVGLALAAVALAYPVVVDGWTSARGTYRASSSLDVRGSSRLRLDPTLAADLRSLVADVGQRCSTLLGYPGFGSLHLWTGIQPVTDLNPGDWMELLDEKQQQRVVDALAGKPRPCVVWNETVYRHWMRGRPAAEGPLVDYADSFVPVARHGRYEVRIDKAEGRG